jgi:hypothetical protein
VPSTTDCRRAESGTWFPSGAGVDDPGEGRRKPNRTGRRDGSDDRPLSRKKYAMFAQVLKRAPTDNLDGRPRAALDNRRRNAAP